MTTQDQHQEKIEDRSLSALYQASRREQPAADLDGEILAQAHRYARSRRRRWLIPLSTAAVILLGTSLTLTLVQPPTEIMAPDEMDDAFSEELAPQSPGPASPPAAAPVIKRQAIMPEARQPAVELQSALPSRAATDADVSVPKEKRSAEMKQQRFSTAPAMPEREVGESIRTPQAWIDAMLTMLRKGDLKALRAELVLFRKRYPELPLPSELADFESQSD
ncbi:MAG: hypothetical protein KZQ93_15260 [Candidatus Thiodiazotropha sp. (ex Monitilora ramsayi)]|nr:hypothetical protein [Candidatus Thiodiazotropha sp. (ex Monitilora ramsayi)]